MLEYHTSPREAKLLNPSGVRRMKCNTFLLFVFIYAKAAYGSLLSKLNISFPILTCYYSIILHAIVHFIL